MPLCSHCSTKLLQRLRRTRFRSHQKASVFIGRPVNVINITSRLLDQVPVSLEYVRVAATKADLRSQTVQCAVARSTRYRTSVLRHEEANAILH